MINVSKHLANDNRDNRFYSDYWSSIAHYYCVLTAKLYLFPTSLSELFINQPTALTWWCHYTVNFPHYWPFVGKSTSRLPSIKATGDEPGFSLLITWTSRPWNNQLADPSTLIWRKLFVNNLMNACCIIMMDFIRCVQVLKWCKKDTIVANFTREASNICYSKWILKTRYHKPRQSTMPCNMCHILLLWIRSCLVSNLDFNAFMQVAFAVFCFHQSRIFERIHHIKFVLDTRRVYPYHLNRINEYHSFLFKWYTYRAFNLI